MTGIPAFIGILGIAFGALGSPGGKVAVHEGDYIPLEAEHALTRKVEACHEAGQERCILPHCLGGLVTDALEAASLVHAFNANGYKIKLVFPDDMLSSCALLADKARPYSLITYKTVLGLHAGFWMEWNERRTVTVIRQTKPGETEVFHMPFSKDIQSLGDSFGAFASSYHIKYFQGIILESYWPLDDHAPVAEVKH
jgi:hypothetical protein